MAKHELRSMCITSGAAGLIGNSFCLMEFLLLWIIYG
jgi:hypothetical protein